jgi:hypothetical protein
MSFTKRASRCARSLGRPRSASTRSSGGCERSALAGLGKEGTRLAARLKLGKTAAADPSVFVDWKRRLPAMGRTEVRRLGLPHRRVCEWKAKLSARTLPANGAAVRRLKRALLAD